MVLKSFLKGMRTPDLTCFLDSLDCSHFDVLLTPLPYGGEVVLHHSNSAFSCGSEHTILAPWLLIATNTLK